MVGASSLPHSLIFKSTGIVKLIYRQQKRRRIFCKLFFMNIVFCFLMLLVFKFFHRIILSKFFLFVCRAGGSGGRTFCWFFFMFTALPLYLPFNWTVKCVLENVQQQKKEEKWKWQIAQMSSLLNSTALAVWNWFTRTGFVFTVLQSGWVRVLFTVISASVLLAIDLLPSGNLGNGQAKKEIICTVCVCVWHCVCSAIIGAR